MSTPRRSYQQNISSDAYNDAGGGVESPNHFQPAKPQKKASKFIGRHHRSSSNRRLVLWVMFLVTLILMGMAAFGLAHFAIPNNVPTEVVAPPPLKGRATGTVIEQGKPIPEKISEMNITSSGPCLSSSIFQVPMEVSKIDTTIVIAASSSSFDRASNLIGSIHHWEPHREIALYDLGLTGSQRAIADSWCGVS